MRQQKDLSPEKQIERLKKQILKFGDTKKNPKDKYGIKRQMIHDIEEGLKDE